MAGLHSPARVCPKCGSINTRDKTPPPSLREQLECFVCLTSGAILAAERRRFGLECLDCGFLGVVRHHGFMSRVWGHLIVISLLIGGVIAGVAIVHDGDIGAENYDLIIFLSIAAAVVYMVAIWVIARLLNQLRARGSGASGV